MTEKIHTLATPQIHPEAQDIAAHVSTKHLVETTAVVHRIFKHKGLDPLKVAAAIDFDTQSETFSTLDKTGKKITLGTIAELTERGEIPLTLHMLKIACLLPTLTDHNDVQKIATVNRSVKIVLDSATPKGGGTPSSVNQIAA